MGSGGGGSGVDRAYNRRMATIAEKQQAMSDEYMNFWRESYKPMEEAKIKANIGLIPKQAALAEKQISSGMEFQKMAEEGIDPTEEAARAQAGVEHSFKGATESMARGVARFGLDPTSGIFSDVARQTSLAKARGIAGARTEGKRYAETESFRRLGLASGGGV